MLTPIEVEARHGSAATSKVARGQLRASTQAWAPHPTVDVKLETFAGLASRPDEITASFGIELGAKAGAFIDFADAEAQFTASLNWEKSGLINSAR
jgi:hypothetical protein